MEKTGHYVSIENKMNISQEKWVLVQYSAIWIGFPNQYIIMSELDKNIHNSLCVLE
jgi:hypothetical protein